MYHRKSDCQPLEHVTVQVVPPTDGAAHLVVVTRCERCGAQTRTTLEPFASPVAEQRAS